jgi:hemerythrin superfamily protein
MISDNTPKSRPTPGAAQTEGSTEGDALSLLTEDHAHVMELFAEFHELVSSGSDDDDRRGELVEMICQELTAHAQVEEEIFYPAARNVLADDEILDEATAEHADAKDLIAQLQSMSPSDAEYDRTVQLLHQGIDHHVQQEEGELFPRLRRSELDLLELGERLDQRKEELLAGASNSRF